MGDRPGEGVHLRNTSLDGVVIWRRCEKPGARNAKDGSGIGAAQSVIEKQTPQTVAKCRNLPVHRIELLQKS